MTTPLGVQFFNTDRVVDSLLPLVPQKSLLKAGKYGWLCMLEEGNYHQGQSIATQEALGCSNNPNSFGPPLEEHVHDVEPLVNLRVGEYKVRVGYS